MPEFTGLGTSLVLLLAVALWIAYLVPMWTRKREYLATERNAIRLQQTLRIMAESAEAPEEVRLEADARTIAIQQRAVAKEARLKQAMEHAKAVARARELDEQIKAVEREVRAAVKSSVSRTDRLRRTRLACVGLIAIALVVLVAGALVPGLQLLLVAGGAVAVLGVVGLVAVNASAARVRRVAQQTAPQVRDLVEAREVAAQAVAAEARIAAQVVARTTRTVQADALAHRASASRSWTPQPVPKQRPHVAHATSRSDELLRRARAQLAEDRRAISGPLARVTRLAPSFDELVDGPAAQEPTEYERRLAETQAAAPVRAERAAHPSVRPSVHAPARPSAPLETEQDEHPVRRERREVEPKRPASGSRYASMGLIGDDLVGMDVTEAFARRVG